MGVSVSTPAERDGATIVASASRRASWSGRRQPSTYDSLFGKTDLLASSCLFLSSPILLLIPLSSILLLPLPSCGKSARGVCCSLRKRKRERKRESDGRRDRFAVVAQAYETRVSDEFVIRGNAAILKCSIPSFVADFVTVQAWVTNDGQSYYPTNKHGIVAVQGKDTACSVASFPFCCIRLLSFFAGFFLISGVLGIYLFVYLLLFSGESSLCGLMFEYMIYLGICFPI